MVMGSRVSDLLEQVLDLFELDPASELDPSCALRLFAEIRRIAGPDDVPAMLDALVSVRSNFWVREMLAESLAAAGGLAVLRDLVEAYDLGLREGHDNDGFSTVLVGLVKTNPERSRTVLETLRREAFDPVETIDWLLEFCE